VLSGAPRGASIGAVRIRRAEPRDAARAAEVIAGALAEHGLPFEPDGRDADVKSFGARTDTDDLVAVERAPAAGRPSDDGRDDAGARVLGIVSVGPHGDDGVAWLSKLFVVATARRAGVGRALLEAAHDAARARGYTTVGLRTRAVFVDAIRLYEKSGYAPSADPRALLESGDRVYYRAL
jgi:putative acetyltransferase